MRIKWQGHACFYVTGNDVCVVTDPYTPQLAGLAPLREPADVVVTSSDNDAFHCYAEGVPGNPIVVNALDVARHGGSQEVNGLRIDAIEAMESVIHKAHPDQNAMYRFTVDGVQIGHMGDVGNPLTPAQLDFFRGVDVLLALTGGPPTIELDDLDLAIRQIKPKVVIPMHYQIPNLRLNILGLEAFTQRYPAALLDLRNEATAEFTREQLAAQPAAGPRIVALQPAAALPQTHPSDW
jgi:L-ascorbate metabolism protein UlaG (beta-lactamase superfamily)